MRAALFVDGFNLYHAIDEFNDDRLKWLSLWSLGERIIRQRTDKLVSCHYFSAYANHLQARHPDVLHRHRTYVAALRSTGVAVTLGTFKGKEMVCKSCGSKWRKAEEKETDVNIAVALVSAAYRDLYDVAYVLTADTDIIPAMREVRSVVNLASSQAKRIVAVFPPIAPGKKRHVASLQQNSDAQVNLNLSHLAHCRLADEIPLEDGGLILCPPEYK